jgi:hypothetical protein
MLMRLRHGTSREGSDGLGRARVTRATDEPVRARLLLAAAGEAIVEAARKSGIV